MPQEQGEYGKLGGPDSSTQSPDGKLGGPDSSTPSPDAAKEDRSEAEGKQFQSWTKYKTSKLLKFQISEYSVFNL